MSKNSHLQLKLIRSKIRSKPKRIATRSHMISLASRQLHVVYYGIVSVGSVDCLSPFVIGQCDSLGFGFKPLLPGVSHEIVCRRI